MTKIFSEELREKLEISVRESASLGHDASSVVGQIENVIAQHHGQMENQVLDSVASGTQVEHVTTDISNFGNQSRRED